MGGSWKHSLGEGSNHSGIRLASIFTFTFTHKKSLQSDAFTHERFKTEILFHRDDVAKGNV